LENREKKKGVGPGKKTKSPKKNHAGEKRDPLGGEKKKPRKEVFPKKTSFKKKRGQNPAGGGKSTGTVQKMRTPHRA